MGIIIDTYITYAVHVSEKIKMDNNMLWLIIRSFSCQNDDILLPLYKELVRHILEYGAPVLGGHLKSLKIRATENIHMRVTEMIE